ncbi:MAG TPA: type VI secretion protein IcmF/TssM N-terminal domain-containing protein [Thermoanaerobaculia bacterium]|nr:type VI secretion protein IcmF/TssM N-terminal domain-containing protein [Thermoanaerobaculia bacterium]
MEFFSELSGNFALALGLILLGAALLLIAVVALINRARDRATYTDLNSGGTIPPTVPSSEGSLDVVDFRTTASEPLLRASFARALRLLRDYLPGRGARYRLPWLLSIGQAAAGKTTLLAHTELKMPFGEPEERSRRPRLPFLWWFYDRAVTLDVTGDLVLRLDGATSDQRSWSALLQQLRKHRGRRPVDGALLSIPVTEIFDFNPADSRARGALAQHAELLRRRIEQAQRQLGFQFPVYVLVTQCDRLPGFSELVASCEPGQLRQMFGWSNPNTPEVPYSDAWVDDAFESVGLALDRQQMRVLYEAQRPLAETQGFLAFPAALEALREAVRIYWNQIFAGGTEDEPLVVRGLYFVGGEGFEEDKPVAHPDFHRRVDFLGDLFGYKVLYEWSLARPLTRELTRRRWLRSALQVLILGQLFLGPPILWWSGTRIAQNAGRLNDVFLREVSTALTHRHERDGQSLDLLREDALGLLAAANVINDYRLRSVALPTSWWSPHVDDITEAGTVVYEQVVFPAIWQQLEAQLSSRASGGAGAGGGAPEPVIENIESVPEFQELQRMVRKLGTLENDYAIYHRYARIDGTQMPDACAADEADWQTDLQDLGQSLDPTFQLTIPTYWSRSYYEDVLCDLPPLPPTPEAEIRHQATLDLLGSRVEETGSLMLRHLFENNVLVEDLEEMQLGINDLSLRPPPPGRANAVYAELLGTIDRTDEDLALPTLAWAGEESFTPTGKYQNLLGAIAQSPFLGDAYTQQIRAEGDEGFAALQVQLAAYSTPATGPLLVQKGGVAELQLAPNIEGLRTVLDGLVTQYTRPPQGGQLTPRPPAGTYLAWNPSLLASAVELLDNYRTFMATSFRSFPGLQQSVNQGTRLTVEANVLDMVGQAQSFPSMPEISSRATLEAQLQRQVDNLSLSSASLNTLLQGLTQPPPVSGCRGNPALSYCQLATVLLNQQALLLQQLDRLYALQNLYVPSRGSIVGWDGQGNLAWKAFGVQNAAGLDSYVANQRLIVQTLATQYARPILGSTSLGAGVPSGSGAGAGAGGASAGSAASSNLAAYQALASSAAYKRWALILSDLADYQSKAPNNALLLLETFITADLPAVTADTCLVVTPAMDACFAPSTATALTTNPPPCDPFMEARSRLQQSVQLRCEPLTLQAGDAAYRTIKNAFDTRLAGKYPFAPVDARPARDATPADIAAFFAVYDAERPKVDRMIQVGERSLRRNPQSPLFPWPGRTTQSIHDFLTDLQTVRGFFATYLAAVQSRPKTPPVPTFALHADLRPDPSRELGGNEIIERALRVGQTTVRSGMPLPSSAAAAPTWSYGTPIRLWLRWARNGPTAPQRPPEDTAARIEERTLIYDYTSPWSLLRLLQEKAAPQIQGVADPLLLEIPTETVVPSTEPETRHRRRDEEAAQPSLLFADARVVLSLGLTTADDKATEVDLPPFPTEAPATTVPPVAASAQ